jgi:hypothetical protein
MRLAVVGRFEDCRRSGSREKASAVIRTTIATIVLT